MPNLIEHILKRRSKNNIKIKSAFLGDGSYDSNENFKYPQKKRIMPSIKVRKNFIISSKNNKIRNKEKLDFKQKKYLKWKKKRMYGKRWVPKETVFSSIKRMFGEYTLATRFQNMVKEMMMKVSLYNLFRRLA